MHRQVRADGGNLGHDAPRVRPTFFTLEPFWEVAIRKRFWVISKPAHRNEMQAKTIRGIFMFGLFGIGWTEGQVCRGFIPTGWTVQIKEMLWITLGQEKMLNCMDSERKFPLPEHCWALRETWRPIGMIWSHLRAANCHDPQRSAVFSSRGMDYLSRSTLSENRKKNVLHYAPFYNYLYYCFDSFVRLTCCSWTLKNSPPWHGNVPSPVLPKSSFSTFYMHHTVSVSRNTENRLALVSFLSIHQSNTWCLLWPLTVVHIEFAVRISCNCSNRWKIKIKIIASEQNVEDIIVVYSGDDWTFREDSERSHVDKGCLDCCLRTVLFTHTILKVDRSTCGRVYYVWSIVLIPIMG